MSELRWILIGFAIVLLAGIYLWGRRSGKGTVASEDALVRVRPEPGVQSRSYDEQGHADAEVEPRPSAPAPVPARHEEPVITAVRPVFQSEPQRASAWDPEAAGRNKPASSESWRGRVEPTLGESAQTEELPVHAEPKSSSPAPTLSLSDSPPPKRIERRKILSLRLAANPQRLDGAKLLEMLTTDSLQHGRYDVFHRLHEDGSSIFSVASMVEPGTFDVSRMPETTYPGVTLFAQLPGPMPGMHALNELIACARRLQQSLGGTLQDDRGVPLTVHRIERMRQEVREFERPSSQAGRSTSVSPSTSP